jgi:hypothetical protein
MLFRIVSAPSFFVGLASATCWRREHPEMDFWSVRARTTPEIAGGSKPGKTKIKQRAASTPRKRFLAT